MLYPFIYKKKKKSIENCSKTVKYFILISKHGKKRVEHFENTNTSSTHKTELK